MAALAVLLDATRRIDHTTGAILQRLGKAELRDAEGPGDVAARAHLAALLPGHH